MPLVTDTFDECLNAYNDYKKLLAEQEAEADGAVTTIDPQVDEWLSAWSDEIQDSHRDYLLNSYLVHTEEEMETALRELPLI